MNCNDCRKKHWKDGNNRLFDLSRFDEWFDRTYVPVNCGGLPVPETVPFREHIRILKERDNFYASLLNEHNELIERYNKLQKAYCEVTGEEYYEEGTD